MSDPVTFPMAFFDRLRMATDGTGVTTLIGAFGCPLQCRMCINPQTWDPVAVEAVRGDKPPFERITPEELYERVRLDHLYFLATGGGVTFGGGEPLVHAAFLAAFRTLCPPEWHINAESCLHIDPHLLPRLAETVDHFYIDIKDMDPIVYKTYTGCDNALVKQNLATLLALVGPERITARVPHIPGYNTDIHVKASLEELDAMGVRLTDEFTYKKPKQLK